MIQYNTIELLIQYIFIDLWILVRFAPGRSTRLLMDSIACRQRNRQVKGSGDGIPLVGKKPRFRKLIGRLPPEGD